MTPRLLYRFDHEVDTRIVLCCWQGGSLRRAAFVDDGEIVDLQLTSLYIALPSSASLALPCGRLVRQGIHMPLGRYCFVAASLDTMQRNERLDRPSSANIVVEPANELSGPQRVIHEWPNDSRKPVRITDKGVKVANKKADLLPAIR